MSILKMSDIDLKDKKVLIRQDLNVPIKDGVITSDQRIQASIPTIRQALDAGASVILMSHLGRPTEGQKDQQYSLLPVAEHLMDQLKQPVRLVNDYLDNEIELKAGEVVLLENVRFNVGEKSNDEDLARQYASLCDVFVMDAFGTAHRAQASTYGAGVYAPIACAGPLLARELDALANAMESPKKPLVAIVGGSKVSTKLTVLESLMGVVDYLIVGGGIANTFIAASGHNVGKSLYEADLLETCKKLMDQARSRGADIPVPVDVVCAKEFSESAEATTKPVAEVAEDDMILDIGPQTCEELKNILASAGTIIWNGPVGVFEIDQFAGGTESISNAIADARGFTLAGGGDTLAAVDKYNIADKVSYISTGGGAFLEFLEGKKLPAVEMLETKAQSTR